MSTLYPPRPCTRCGALFNGGTLSKFCPTCRFVTKTCAICGKIFTVNRCHDFVETCSRKCGYAFKKRNAAKARGKRRPPCTTCGKPITRKSWNYGKKKAKHYFCSTRCTGIWQSKHRRGSNNATWRGGYKEYYGANWREQRRNARKRDKVCQRCGKTPKENGKALDVHHLIPFRKFGLKHFKQANDLNNLISLCMNCHQLVEWENGRP